MGVRDMDNQLSAEVLQRIIRFQQNIIRLGPDFTAVMAEAAQGAQELTGSDGAVIEIVEADELVYRAASVSAQSLLGSRVRLKGSLSGACIQCETVLISQDVANDARVDRLATQRLGVAAMIVCPLIFEGACVGVLKVFSRSCHAFDDEDTHILEIISATISASMFVAAKVESSELFHIATHDFLTGVANRALFHDRLKQRIAQSVRIGDQFAIVMVDMDKLKLINDQYGHRLGDLAIKSLAERLCQQARSSDTVARLGGDEFVILLHQILDAHCVKNVCLRLITALEGCCLSEEADIGIQASIGYAVFPIDGQDMESLMEHADQSMYANKRSKPWAESNKTDSRDLLV